MEEIILNNGQGRVYLVIEGTFNVLFIDQIGGDFIPFKVGKGDTGIEKMSPGVDAEYEQTGDIGGPFFNIFFALQTWNCTVIFDPKENNAAVGIGKSDHFPG